MIQMKVFLISKKFIKLLKLENVEEEEKKTED